MVQELCVQVVAQIFVTKSKLAKHDKYRHCICKQEEAW